MLPEWLSATSEYKDLGIDDYIRLTDEAVEEIRRRTGLYRIHIVGECQGRMASSHIYCFVPRENSQLGSGRCPHRCQCRSFPNGGLCQAAHGLFPVPGGYRAGSNAGKIHITGI